MLTPVFGDDLCLLERVADLTVEALISWASVETLHITVLPSAARFDGGSVGTLSGNPFANGLGYELRAVVRANVLWHAA